MWLHEKQQLQVYPIDIRLRDQMRCLISRERGVLADQNIYYSFPSGKKLDILEYPMLCESLVEVEFYATSDTRGGGIKWEVKQITVLN